MLQPLNLQSEKYSANGNATSQGILNQLGRPALDILSILIRETVQNSWDARLSEAEPVKFQVIGRSLNDKQLRFLQDVVLRDTPPTLNLRSGLSSSLEVPVLVISDRGSIGLGGPTRADVLDDGTGTRNFVNFFRNVGQTKNKQQMGGGTYGYGKSVLYRVSAVHTICVYTRCLVDGKPESRFMAAALEPEAEEQKTTSLLTGRHWWGLLIDDVIEPVTGEDADIIASELGLPGFGEDELGTTCMLLLPDFGEASMEEVLKRTTRILLWYFWPKMLENKHGIVPMKFEVLHDKRPVPIPAPDAFPPLQGFVRAMQALKREGLAEKEDFMQKVSRIRSPKLKKDLGWLVLQRFPLEARVDPDTETVDSFPPISGVSFHVALMRQAELVVKYLKGIPLATSQIEYAGVFIADAEVDQAFAKAEPPTHDDWNSASLSGQEKTCVNVALSNIDTILRSFVTPLPTTSKGGLLSPMGVFADQLGSLLIGQDGPGGYEQPVDMGRNGNQEPVPGNGGGQDMRGGGSTYGGGAMENDNGRESSRVADPSRRSRAKIRLTDEGRLDLVEEMPARIIEFQIEHATSSHASKVSVDASVVLDSGEQEKEAPRGSERPEVLQWTDADGKVRSGSEAIVISSTDNRPWKVAVSIPDNTLLNIDLAIEEIF